MSNQRRRSRKGSVVTVIAVISLWAGLIVSVVVIRFVGWIILTGAVGCICYILGSRNAIRADSIYSSRLRNPENTITGNVYPSGSEPNYKLPINHMYGPGWHGSEITSNGRTDFTDARSAYPRQLGDMTIDICPECGAATEIRDGMVMPHHRPSLEWLMRHNPGWTGVHDGDRRYCAGPD